MSEKTHFASQPNVEFCAENMHRFAVAPMLEVTDRHFRAFCRLLSRQTTLWTEMIHADAIINSSFTTHLLGFSLAEHPLVLQLGGSEPDRLGAAARIAAKFGFTELNLNCGCPSPRVTAGRFGACLMLEPQLVAQCLRQMAGSGLPCSVKCRIGVDDEDSYAFVHRFVDVVSSESPCKVFVIHARKAYLKGLSPKENRTVPPLDYEVVLRLAADFPTLTFVLNGGIKTLGAASVQLGRPGVAGVMLGRAVTDSIWQLADVDRSICNSVNPCSSRREALLAYAEYADAIREQEPRTSLSALMRPLVSLFTGEKGAAAFRQLLSDRRAADEAGSLTALVKRSISMMESANLNALDTPPGAV